MWIRRGREGGHLLSSGSLLQLLGALDAAADAVDSVHVLQQLPGGVLGDAAAAAREQTRLWRQSGN